MNQLQYEYETITDREIPVITCYPQGAEQLPLVLVNHGTNGCAEGILPFAKRIANEGFFCVCIDAYWHGKRSDGTLQEKLSPLVYKKNYLELLLHMADDMSAIINYYEKDARVNPKKVGMTGISQGGYVAFLTMTKDNRITAAAPIIGSPDLTDQYGNSPPWREIAPEVQKEVRFHNPLEQYEKMSATALLIQNCIEDKIVPITGVRRLDSVLKPLYKKNPDQYRLIEYPVLGHEVTDEMLENVVLWMSEKLK